MSKPIDHVLLTNTSHPRKRDRDSVDSMQELRYYNGNSNSGEKSHKRKSIQEDEGTTKSNSNTSDMYISDVEEVEAEEDKHKRRMGDEENAEVISRLSYSLFYIESVIKAVQLLPEDSEYSFMDVIRHIYNNLKDEVSMDDFETEKCHLTKHLYNIIKSKLVKGFRRVRHGYYKYSPNVLNTYHDNDDHEHNHLSSPPNNFDHHDDSNTDKDKDKEDLKSIVKGEYTYNDGSKYFGETMQGRKHGYGLYIRSNGDEIEGNWVNDEVIGHATLKKKDGSLYKGTWGEGGMTGYGTSETNRMNYNGYWKDGRLHGEGKCTYKDGKVIEGIFRGGSLYEGYITDPVSKSCACIKEGKFHRKTKFVMNQVSEERDEKENNVQGKNTSVESSPPPPPAPNVDQKEEDGSRYTRSSSSFERQRIILVNMKKLLVEQLIDKEDYKAVKDSLLSEYISSTISRNE